MSVLKSIFCAAAAALLLTGLTGCGETKLNDGTYEALSSRDEDGAYAKVTLTIQNGEIADCDYVTFQKSGEIKDENYGKEAALLGNSGFYEKAQRAVAAMKIYRQQLLERKSLDQVDHISGATIAYEQFNEAVSRALEAASAD